MAKPIPHGTSSGYNNHGCRCDDCKAADSARRKAMYARRRDVMLAANAEWRAKNPEKKRQSDASWRARNTQRVVAKHAIWRDVNRSKVRISNEGWRRRNPEAAALRQHVRRARLASADVRTVTAKDWAALCGRFDNRCAYCADVGELTQDHIVPLSRGGRHAIGNLIPACMACNQAKHSKLLVEWNRQKANAARRHS